MNKLLEVLVTIIIGGLLGGLALFMVAALGTEFPLVGIMILIIIVAVLSSNEEIA